VRGEEGPAKECRYQDTRGEERRRKEGEEKAGELGERRERRGGEEGGRDVKSREEEQTRTLTAAAQACVRTNHRGLGSGCSRGPAGLIVVSAALADQMLSPRRVATDLLGSSGV
jgi:hypothetical protein